MPVTFKNDVKEILSNYKVNHSKDKVNSKSAELLNQIKDLLDSRWSIGEHGTVREFYRAEFKYRLGDKVNDSLLFRLFLPYRRKVILSSGFYKEYEILLSLSNLVHKYWDLTDYKPILVDEEYQLYFKYTNYFDDAFHRVNLEGKIK